MKKIAIIGAGLAGLSCARRLNTCAQVQIFEKSRGVSGRMTTRYAEHFQFDHGAQYFTVKTPEFEQFLQPYLQSDSVVDWCPRIVTLIRGKEAFSSPKAESWFIGSPKMNALCKAMASESEVLVGTRIEKLYQEHEKWILTDNSGGTHGPFDYVISSAPAPQTESLFPATFSQYSVLQSVKMIGCFSVMIGCSNALHIPWDVAHVKESPISWIAINSQKPARDTAFSLIAQTTNSWAEQNLEGDLSQKLLDLVKEIELLVGFDLSQRDYGTIHRWRYADTSHSAGEQFLADESMGLFACGDWCISGRIESAFTSGSALGKRVSALC